MKRPPKQPEEDRLLDLEQNLQNNLYSKSDLEEDFLPPSLSPEEFKKLWNKQKTETKQARTEEHTVVNCKRQQEQIEAGHATEATASANAWINNQGELLKALEQSLIELNSKHDHEQNAHAGRGETENLAEPIVRVIRVPLSKDMEDELIRIRRLLNKLYQMKKPREVIDDYQVLLAILNWASKQLEVSTFNSREEDKASPQDKQLKDS